jgi:hypothetical protein
LTYLPYFVSTFTLNSSCFLSTLLPSVVCAHDNVEVGDVKVDLNLKGVK